MYIRMAHCALTCNDILQIDLRDQGSNVVIELTPAGSYPSSVN